MKNKDIHIRISKQEFELNRKEIVTSFEILHILADLSKNYNGTYETKGYLALCAIESIKNSFWKSWKIKIEDDYYSIDEAFWFVMLDGNTENWREVDLMKIYNDLLQICEWEPHFSYYQKSLKYLLKLHYLI